MSYKDIVDGKHYPLRGFSCSADQIRTLKQGIKKFDLFASLEIDEVYEECKLKNSINYKAKTFASLHIKI